MADEVQNQAQEDAAKKVNVPDTVSVGQAVGYDINHYNSRTDRHQELLQRFAVPTYARFEEQLGTPFARSVVAYLLGDADHARVLGNVLISDPLPPVPGGVASDEDLTGADTYDAGKQKVSIKNGAYFVGGHKFVEKWRADLYAARLDNPPAEDKGENIPKPADGNEKTALGADAEVGAADPVFQAQKDKEASGVQDVADQMHVQPNSSAPTSTDSNAA